MKRKITIAILLILLVSFAVIGIANYLNSQKTENNKTMEINNQVPVLIDGFEANITESQIQWHGEKIVGNQHTGTVKLASAKININNSNLESASFVIDMTSIEENGNKDEGVIKHLKSADFFDSEKYPTAELKITKAEKKEGNIFEMTGSLKIKDTTNEIIFPAQIIVENNQILAIAEFNIDRTKWGIKYGSGQFFKDLADKAIKDEINFKVSIKADLKKI